MPDLIAPPIAPCLSFKCSQGVIAACILYKFLGQIAATLECWVRPVSFVPAPPERRSPAEHIVKIRQDHESFSQYLCVV